MIDGLTLVEQFVDEDEERALIAAIDASAWSPALARRTQHYGYRYDYRDRTAPRRAPPLPSWVDAVLRRVAEHWPADRRVYDQLIVNEYRPGQGIAPHTDARVFGDVVLSLSLGAAYPMVFSSGARTHTLALPRRSLLRLERDARYRWRHSISARRADGGVARERRISLTFRTMRTTKIK